MLPSREVNIFFRILNVNKMHRLHYVWFQNNPGQVNICTCILYSNIQTLSCNSPEPMVNRARLDSVQSISFEISAVIKQNHPLTSSIKCFSIIQRVIILNQSNQLFYIKVLYFKMKSKFLLPPRGRRGISFASHAGDRGSIPGRDRPKL